MSQELIEKVAKTLLNQWHDGWEMANADGRKQAMEEAKGMIAAYEQHQADTEPTEAMVVAGGAALTSYATEHAEALVRSIYKAMMRIQAAQGSET